MKDIVKETSSQEGTEEPNLPHPEFCTKENPEQLECSKSKRVRISEQGGSGEKMVAEIQGETKVEDSSHQAKRRGRRRTLTPGQSKERKNERDRKRRKDLNIELGELREMRPQFEDLKKTNAELVMENMSLNSKVAAMAQEIKTLKNCKLRENDSMSVEIPMDYVFLEGQENVDYDLSDDQFFKGIEDLIPSPCPTKKLITQGRGTSQTEVLEPDMKQIRAELDKLRATNIELKRENERLKSKHSALAQNMDTLKKNDKIDNKIPSASPNEELAIATNKHVTRGKGITEGALELKRKREDELNEARKRKLPISVDDDTPTCLTASSTLSGSFVSSTYQFIRQLATALVTQNPLLSTAGGAESREATHDKQASTSASGIKGTTDFLNLVKNMEACVSLVSYFATEIARAQGESRAVNAGEEDGANQAIETADDDD